jgi:hypothetical protein
MHISGHAVPLNANVAWFLKIQVLGMHRRHVVEWLGSAPYTGVNRGVRTRVVDRGCGGRTRAQVTSIESRQTGA